MKYQKVGGYTVEFYIVSCVFHAEKPPFIRSCALQPHCERQDLREALRGAGMELYTHMLLGYFPVRGFNDEPFTDAWRSGRAGTPLADGWRAAYYGHRADLQWFAAMFYYKNYNMNECCCFCNADNTDPDLDPSNLLPDAPWIDTCITHDEYMRDARKLNPLKSIPGWHLWSNFWDCMHGLHLGPGQHVAANCLSELASAMPGGLAASLQTL